jgi:plasmid stabilization system protein ParE
VKVFWTETAINHLQAIREYIAQTSPEYGRKTVDRLTSRSKQIAAFPMSGRKAPEFEMDQIREVIEGQYRIIYYIKPEQIDVLAIIHTSQQDWRKE